MLVREVCAGVRGVLGLGWGVLGGEAVEGDGDVVRASSQDSVLGCVEEVGDHAGGHQGRLDWVN